MAKDPKPMEVLNAQAKQGVNETKQATDRMKQAVEETKGQALGAADKLSAIGKQTMAHAYSAMDYYLSFEKDRSVGTFGRIRIRRESESVR